VIRVTTDGIERLAELIGALSPVPEGWVAAAQQLPESRRSLDDLLMRAEEDAELRARLLANLESALAESGISPTPRLLDLARARLGDG
jgi:hypothetical protein